MYGMKLCVVTENQVKKSVRLPACDLAVFGFYGLGEVDYENEISGRTDKFEEAARLSKQCGCGVIGGCITSGRGLMRKSAAVADRGKLLGISDMTHVIDGEKYKSGAGAGLYTVCGYKVGLCIENDLYFPDVVKALSTCGSNVIVALLSELKDNIPPLLMRSYAYLYGVPFVMCAGKRAYFADINGSIASSSQELCLFETDIKNDYHVIGTRIRGLRQSADGDY